MAAAACEIQITNWIAFLSHTKKDMDIFKFKSHSFHVPAALSPFSLLLFHLQFWYSYSSFNISLNMAEIYIQIAAEYTVWYDWMV